MLLQVAFHREDLEAPELQHVCSLVCFPMCPVGFTTHSFSGFVVVLGSTKLFVWSFHSSSGMRWHETNSKTFDGFSCDTHHATTRFK